MTPFLHKALIAASSAMFALSLVSCAQKYPPLSPHLIILATTFTPEQSIRYVLISRYGRRQMKAMPIADRRMKHIYYVSKRGRLVDRQGRDLGKAPCWIPGVMNSTNESYALSNGGRMIYCIYGQGGGPGPLRSMRIGDLSSLRTSSLQFDDNGPGSIAFLSKTQIVLLFPDESCITRSPGGFADRLVIFNPQTNRIVRYLRCSDAVVRYRAGVALIRRIHETGDKWHYSLDGKTWHDGLFVGATRTGAALYIDSRLDLRIASQASRVLATRVDRAEVFDPGNVANLEVLFRHPKETKKP